MVNNCSGHLDCGLPAYPGGLNVSQKLRQKMGLNIQKGNMYGFVTHTWNTVKGKCLHDCSYCYMKQFKLNPVRFDKKELKTKLQDKEFSDSCFIFIGSSCDMFADNIPFDWIRPFDTMDEYFISIVAVEGNWTNYGNLSIDPFFSTYFDSNFIIK